MRANKTVEKWYTPNTIAILKTFKVSAIERCFAFIH